MSVQHRGRAGAVIVVCVCAATGCDSSPRSSATRLSVPASATSATAGNGEGNSTLDQPGRGLQPVTLPDLSAMEPAVRAQMEAKFASLKTLLASGRSTREELATGYGAAGQLLMAANFLDAAETCFLNAQTLSAGDGRWPYYLGHIYKGKGPVDKSVSAFDRALQLMPDDVPAMIGLGEADLAAGHPENADGVFAKALARRPSEAAAWFGAGRAALARRDYRRAINQLTRALELAPQATKIHYSLAMAYRAAGDMSKATAHLARQGDVDTRVTDPLMREIDVLLQSAEAYNIRGGAELAAGHWQAAASAFRQGLELAPDDPSLRHRLGTALYQMGDVPGAMAEFQRVLQTSPGYTQSSYSLGVLLSEAGRYPEAIEHFSTALKRQPDYVEARIQLADVLRRTGRPEQALAEYARVLAAAPTNTDAAFGQAMALIRIDRYAEARDRLAALLGAHPDQAMFSHALARLLAAAPDNRVRDGRRALQLVDQLVKGEQTIELAETTAMALAEVGRYREAVDVQRDALTAATSANLPLVRRHIEANLRLYEAGTPCRTPFADDEFR